MIKPIKHDKSLKHKKSKGLKSNTSILSARAIVYFLSFYFYSYSLVREVFLLQGLITQTKTNYEQKIYQINFKQEICL